MRLPLLRWPSTIWKTTWPATLGRLSFESGVRCVAPIRLISLCRFSTYLFRLFAFTVIVVAIVIPFSPVILQRIFCISFEARRRRFVPLGFQYFLTCFISILNSLISFFVSVFFDSAHFNKKFHPTWHCIVGRNFAANVTHETKNFTYFYLGQTGFLLWKSG